MSEQRRQPQLYGVLVTFRRPAALAGTLSALSNQTRSLEQLVVVDNEPTADTREIVRAVAPDAEYLPATENLGPAGGIALGMQRLLEVADDRDWIVTLDDDDPPRDPRVFSTLHAFAAEMSAREPPTGAVGEAGVRFDRRRGRMVRVDDAELRGAVSVDCIAGNQLPCYSVEAIRAVGPPRPELFFGLEELDLGLRLRDAGYAMYAHGSAWYEHRRRLGRLDGHLVPRRSLGDATWRQYYSLRNLVDILRDRGAVAAAMRVTVVVGLAKPLANLVRDPRRASRRLRLNLRACRDAWAHRMGRTVEPTP